GSPGSGLLRLGRLLLAPAPGRQNLLADFLGGVFDVLHQLPGPRSRGLVAPFGLANVLFCRGDKLLESLECFHGAIPLMLGGCWSVTPSRVRGQVLPPTAILATGWRAI